VSGYQKSSIKIINGQIDGETTVDNCVLLIRSALEFEDVYIRNSKLNGIHGEYAQYTFFTGGAILNCGTTDDSHGAMFKNITGGERSNEIRFTRTRILSNMNGIGIYGGEQCTFRDVGFLGQKNNGNTKRAALIIDFDDLSNGARVPTVDGCWFEFNDSRDIYLGVVESPQIKGCFFTGANGDIEHPNKIDSVFSTTCFDINHNGNFYLSAAPAVFTATHLTPGLTSIGNTKEPDYSGVTNVGEFMVLDKGNGMNFQTNGNFNIQLDNAGASLIVADSTGSAKFTASPTGNIIAQGTAKASNLTIRTTTPGNPTGGEAVLYFEGGDLKYKRTDGVARTISFT